MNTKTYLKIQHKKWHLANKERNNRLSREYYYNHLEERKAKARKWKKENREKNLSGIRRWKQKHKEEIKIYKKEYLQKSSRYRKWKNFEERRRRIKKLNNGGSHTLQEWENLKKEYDYQCACCHRKEPEIKLTEDHIISLDKNGNDNINNIQPLCQSCNSWKWNREMRFLKPELISVY